MAVKTSTSVVTINATDERVWRVLTEPSLVKRWQYGSDLITDWTPGSPIRFRTEWDGSVFEQWGTVLEFEPCKRLGYTLFAPAPGVEDVPENYFTMTYELEPADGSVKVSIIQEDPREGRSQEPDETAPDEDNPVLSALKAVAEES
jgi:uncharacterized protein YndB with AHSA1/START domain